jgi:alkylhydroperoxidase family enzyme
MAMRTEAGLADGLTEDLVCSLERPFEAPDLTDAEKVALNYADLVATNHLAISDETIDGLRQHYSEQECRNRHALRLLHRFRPFRRGL